MNQPPAPGDSATGCVGVDHGMIWLTTTGFRPGGVHAIGRMPAAVPDGAQIATSSSATRVPVTVVPALEGPPPRLDDWQDVEETSIDVSSADLRVFDLPALERIAWKNLPEPPAPARSRPARTGNPPRQGKRTRPRPRPRPGRTVPPGDVQDRGLAGYAVRLHRPPHHQHPPGRPIGEPLSAWAPPVLEEFRRGLPKIMGRRRTGPLPAPRRDSSPRSMNREVPRAR
jgi:hypothetical protein